MRDEDVIALADAALDEPRSAFSYVMKVLRDEWPCGILMARDRTIWALKQSKHPKAKETLDRFLTIYNGQ